MVEKLRQVLSKRWNFILGSIVFLSLAVLFYIGRYAVMAADDYTYGLEPRQAWLATGSLWEVIKMAFRTIFESRAEWQGTYMSIFLMGLNPGVLNERLTVFISFIILMPYCLGIALFFKELCKRFFSQDKSAVTTIVFCTIFVTVQTFYDPSEAIYWYNGAIHYMFMQSMLLILFGVMLKLDGLEKYSHKNWVWIVISCILAVVVAGGNFVTVLQGLIVMTTYLALRAVGKKLRWQCLLPYLLFGCFAMFNLTAPGNTVRKEVTVGCGPVESVMSSLRYGLVFMTEWTGYLVVLSLLLLVPFIWKAVGRTERKYSYPLLFAAFSYGVYAAMFTPLFYGMGDVYVDRALNIVKWMYYIILVLNLMYVLGWLRYKAEHSDKGFFKDVVQIAVICEKYKPEWICICGGLVLAILVLTPDKNTYTSVSAARSLLSGEAKAYYQEQLDREELYYDESQPVLYLEAIQNRPHVLFHGDIYADDTDGYWINKGLAEYYGKNAIHLVQETK